MRIAVFHNLGTGGGKRHLFEQVRELAARGHEIHLFALRSSETAEYLPIQPFCRETHLYGEDAGPAAGTKAIKAAGPASSPSRIALVRAAKTLLTARALMDLVWSRRMEKRIESLGQWYSKMATDIDKGHYDVAYVHHCAVTLAPDLLRHIKRTPTVFCCHDTQRSVMQWPVETGADYDNDSNSLFVKRRRGRLLSPAQVRFSESLEYRFIKNTRAASLVLANSWYSRETLAQSTGVDSHVCYPGVDTDFFCPGARKPQSNASEKTVLSVGALLPSKRHLFVLESVAAIPLSKRPRLKILGYVGGPNSAELEAFLIVRAHELDVRLTVCKDADETELRAAYRDAAVVAFAPYLEPFGLAAVEAMSCGTPVVGVREAGVRETVTHDVTGLLTPFDCRDFAEAITCLLTQPDFATKLGEQARQDVQERWTWKRSVDVLERFLEDAMSTEVVRMKQIRQ